MEASTEATRQTGGKKEGLVGEMSVFTTRLPSPGFGQEKRQQGHGEDP